MQKEEEEEEQDLDDRFYKKVFYTPMFPLKYSLDDLFVNFNFTPFFDEYFNPKSPLFQIPLFQPIDKIYDVMFSLEESFRLHFFDIQENSFIFDNVQRYIKSIRFSVVPSLHILKLMIINSYVYKDFAIYGFIPNILSIMDNYPGNIEMEYLIYNLLKYLSTNYVKGFKDFLDCDFYTLIIHCFMSYRNRDEYGIIFLSIGFKYGFLSDFLKDESIVSHILEIINYYSKNYINLSNHFFKQTLSTTIFNLIKLSGNNEIIDLILKNSFYFELLSNEYGKKFKVLLIKYYLSNPTYFNDLINDENLLEFLNFLY